MKMPMRYNKKNTPSTHIEEVSKYVGENGITQVPLETFTSQDIRWWEMHSPRIQT
jgi:hypothetical protein